MSQISLGIRCFFFFLVLNNFKAMSSLLLRNQSKIKKKKTLDFY
jgi:hypothetical protein